jgi:protein gp37
MTMPRCAKARSLQNWFVEISVEKLDWPVQSPDLNTIEHLWNEMERGLRARPNQPTLVPNLTKCSKLKVLAAMFQHLSGKPSQKSGKCYSSKAETISMPMILE